MKNTAKKEFAVGDKIRPIYRLDGEPATLSVVSVVKGKRSIRGNWFLGFLQSVQDEYVLMDDETGRHYTLELDSWLWANDYEVVK